MSITLSPLPYREDALEPYLSRRTVALHYHQHQGSYVTRTNELLEQQSIRPACLEELVTVAWKGGHAALFNAASQAWNHEIFWRSLTPEESNPSDEFARIVDRDFGSLEMLKQKLKEAALAQFGSGWAWLVWCEDRLRVTRTSNADSPLTHDQRPLFAIDVWEHAYYLDYQNKRRDYVDTLLNHLADWGAASRRFDSLGSP